MVGPGRQFSGLTSDNNNLTGFVEQEETSSLDSAGKEPVFIEWTDEKHSMYLKSMEASFVDQLYKSRDFLGWRPQDEHLFGSNPRLCRQEYHCASATDYAGRPITHSEMNGFIHMPQGCGGQKLHSYGSENMLKRYVVSKQYHNSVDVNEAEVSDQNFVDEGPGEGDSGGLAHGTKRKSLELTPSMINDQVVPFGASHCPMPDLGEGCSSSNQLVGRDCKATKTGSSAF